MVPRLLDLDGFINVDGALRWFPRSLRFYSAISEGAFENTMQSRHPGVTVMLLSGASIIVGSVVKFGSLSPWEHSEQLVFFAKLPLALVTGAGTLWVGRLLERAVAGGAFAGLAVFFLAIDPLFLAHSRYLQLDATNAIFLLLSLLCFAIYCCHGGKRQLLQSAVFAGFAVLTRTTSLAIVPYVVVLMGLRTVLAGRTAARTVARDLMLWCGVAAAIFIACWPAMWVAPVQTMTALTGAVAGAYDIAHEDTGSDATAHSSQSAGKIPFSPQLGKDFITFRFSYALALGSLGAAVLIYRHMRRTAQPLETVLLCLLGFGAYFLFGLSFFAKAVTIPLGFRYALVSFVIFQLSAAFGAHVLLKFVWTRTAAVAKPAAISLAVILGLWMSVRTFGLHPYYQVYHNAFASARHPGWGEGLELVARHLNAHEDAEHLVVASDFASVLGYYFKGKVIWIDQVEHQKVDYIVIYNTGLDSSTRPEKIRCYVRDPSNQPEFIAVLNGVPYAWLYRVSPSAAF